jgi:hypothetical protein
VFDVFGEVFTALLRLPSARTLMAEQHLDLFKCLAAGLGVCEEDLDCSEQTEYSKDDEETPLDADERGRDEQADGEVEEPLIS